MQNASSRLSSLDPLIAFEAAARLSSFALAAKELDVTASAVSQQIKALEQNLGVPLFTRKHRSVHLTDKGREFSSSVSVALVHLRNAAVDLSRTPELDEVVLAADTSMTAHWVMPRLNRLESTLSGCSIRIYATDVRDDLLKSDFHIAIVHGEGNWRGYESALLFEENVFPVCSPSYLEHAMDKPDVAQLPNCDLLDLEYEHWHWMNWTIWLTESGLPMPSRRRKITSNNYPSLIDAAKNGLGFALGWEHLHDEDLKSGSLVAPFQDSVKTRYGYHLVWPYNRTMPSTVQAVRDWVLAEFKDNQKN